jgi:hypothetical protein
MRKILVAAYYFSVAVFLFACTVYIPYQCAEESRVSYTNKMISEFKQANMLTYLDEYSVAEKQIRDSGFRLQKTEYKKLSGELGLLACTMVLILTLFLPFSRLSDVIWIGGWFSVLYSYESMSTAFYLAIMILALATYYFKKKRASSGQKGK